MKKKILQSLVVLTIVLVGGFWGVQKVYAEGWENVGNAGFSNGEVGSISLAFSPIDNNPFVSFRDYTNSGKIAVMKYTDNSWKNVGEPRFSFGAIYDTSLAFNPESDEPFVSFIDDYNNLNQVILKKYSNNEWQTVGGPVAEGVMAYRVHLAFNPKNNEPYVAYVILDNISNSYQLVTKRYSNGSWEEVGNPIINVNVSVIPSFAFQSESGDPYLAYTNSGNQTGKLSILKYDGNSWESVGNSDANVFGLSSLSLAFNPTTKEPYVSYVESPNSANNGNTGVQVIKYSNNLWKTVGELGGKLYHSNYPSLAFNPQNSEPYVAFFDTNNPESEVATVLKFSEGIWQKMGSEGPSNGNYAYNISIVFNSKTSEPYVAFSNADNGGKVTVTKYVGDSNPPPPSETRQPALYGLFIGSRKNSIFRDDFRADKAASNMLHVFNNLRTTINVTYARSIEGDFDTGGIAESEIHSMIKDIKSKINLGDIFFFYINAHGDDESDGAETTKTKGDEYLEIGPGKDDESTLTDDELLQMLQNMDDVNKWLVVDACHSGGFWGNDNGNDQGDLEKLKNTAFIAAAEEDKLTGYSDEGISALSMALTDGLSLDSNNEIKAAKGNNKLTLESLYKWAVDDWQKECDNKESCKFIYEMGFGEYINPSEMGKFVSNETNDFVDGIDISTSQDPTTHPEIYPIADGNGPYESSTGKVVSFDASKSYDSDGTIEKYEWDWDNDGNYDESSSSSTAEHTWNSPLSEGIVGLQVTDNNGLSSTDKILVNISSKTICSTLKGDKRFDFSDTFKLKSGKNEKVTVKLRPNENGEYTNGRATLTLWPGIHQFRKEKGTLPLELNATLSRSAWYNISVLRKLGKNGFTGDYCVTLESSGDAWQTLKATRNVE